MFLGFFDFAFGYPKQHAEDSFFFKPSLHADKVRYTSRRMSTYLQLCHGLHNCESGNDDWQEENYGRLVLMIRTVKYLVVWSM